MPSLKFESAMEAEHCRSKDSMKVFTKANSKSTTYPQKEWLYVVKGEHEKEDMNDGRVVRDIDELLESHNKFVPTGGAKITRPEVISVVLYTGPMVSGLGKK